MSIIPSIILYLSDRVVVSGVEARLYAVPGDLGDRGDLGDLAILLVLDLPKPYVLEKGSFLFGISTVSCLGLLDSFFVSDFLY